MQDLSVDLASGVAGEMPGVEVSDVSVGTAVEMAIDCNGVVGGSAVIDECGVCGQPAIANATITSINHETESVTLTIADSTIAVGQVMQLANADGQVCGTTPLGVDLEVQSVNGTVIVFGTDIVMSGVAADCVLIRRALCEDCAGVSTAMGCSSAAGNVQRTVSGAWECDDGSTVMLSQKGPNRLDQCGTCDSDDSSHSNRAGLEVE